MPTNITIVPTDLTWDNTELSWNDEEMSVKDWTTAVKNNVSCDNLETLTFAENRSYNLAHITKETVNIVEMYTDLINYVCTITETIGILEKPVKDYIVQSKEVFGVVERMFKTLDKVSIESLTINDLSKTSNLFNIIIQESFACAELLQKQYKVSVKESFVITSDFIKRCNAVISDIIISNKELTLQDFIAQVSNPVGFEGFRDFQPGEYEYQKALIKIIMDASVMDIRPQISSWTLNVDIEDTKDRGQISIPAVATIVNFNRKYYTVPEVVVTIKGGTVANISPFVYDVTTTGFTVVLKDSNGNVVSGLISWSSLGY